MRKDKQILFVGGSIILLLVLVATNILLMRSQKEPYQEKTQTIQRREPTETVMRKQPQAPLDIEQEAPIQQKELNN